MGAWIETEFYLFRFSSATVAPYVGAWIETIEQDSKRFAYPSHPMWVRGLKLAEAALYIINRIKSHPMWVRGLKLIILHLLITGFCRTLCGCVD